VVGGGPGVVGLARSGAVGRLAIKLEERDEGADAQDALAGEANNQVSGKESYVLEKGKGTTKERKLTCCQKRKFEFP